MEDLGRLLSAALAIVTLATAAGLGLQRAQVSSLRTRLKDSDEELARKGRRLDEAITELDRVRTDLAALTRVVTGEAHWVSIGQKLDEHHEEATGHWTRADQLLAEIRDRLPPPAAAPPPSRSPG